ncbi:hypothetical protein SLEP1_g11772 [Rubroshorea leprosula]|nr:hypothetical protein SLEP1_g11772 [Rubroshorea leprosula]
MGGRTTSSGSSSGEEEGDAEWKAAIASIAATTPFATNGFNNSSSGGSATKTSSKPFSHSSPGAQDDGEQQHQPQKLKSYQIKAQKILNGMLEKSLEFVRDTNKFPESDPREKDNGVQLFKNSPHGIVFDHVGNQQLPRKRPKILPERGIDEKPKKVWLYIWKYFCLHLIHFHSSLFYVYSVFFPKMLHGGMQFRQRLKTVAVDGNDILAAAQVASQKSLARLEAKEAAAKAKAKREEERVAELKKIRGERWLPAIAKEMQLNKSSGRQL